MNTVCRDELNRTLSVAPMMDWTDRHCRYFHRLLAPAALLYTEMVTTGAILHGDVDRFLAFSPQEHPLALQLGGSDPEDLAACARMAEQHGFDEVNLNVGCPSDRVQRGRFGACLMLEPDLVTDCMRAMLVAVRIPVTIKSRLGVDDHYSYESMRDFVGKVSESGCRVFIMHARKAVLAGLSPKQRIDTVFDYKQVFKDYCINDDRRPPHQQNGSGVIYSKAVRRQPEQSHQSQVESSVQATRSVAVTTV